MFSWVLPQHNSAAAAADTPAPPSSFDPLKGLGGAVAFYTAAAAPSNTSSSSTGDTKAIESLKLIGSAAAFYANVARERLLADADAAVPTAASTSSNTAAAPPTTAARSSLATPPRASSSSSSSASPAASASPSPSPSPSPYSYSPSSSPPLGACPGVSSLNDFLRQGRRGIDGARGRGREGEGTGGKSGGRVTSPDLEGSLGVEDGLESVRLLFKVVIGCENADLDAIVSAMVYAYLLDQSERASSAFSSLCVVPLVHCARSDFHLRTDATWLLNAVGVDSSALLFMDEVDLRSLHAEGRVQIVLYGHNHMPATIEGLEKAVAGIIPRETGTVISHPIFPRTSEEGHSCSAMLARRLSEEAPHLVGNTAVARLLLAPILLSTTNLDQSQASEVDGTMAAFLMGGARGLGKNVFYEILRTKKHDQMGLTTEEVLRADFVRHAMGPGVRGKRGGEVLSVALSTIGLSAAQLIGKDAQFEATVKAFLASRSLHLLVVLSTYYSQTSKRFKREVLLLAPVPSFASGVAFFLQQEKHNLKLRPVTVRGMPSWIKAFSQGNLGVARSDVEHMLVEYLEEGR